MLFTLADGRRFIAAFAVPTVVLVAFAGTSVANANASQPAATHTVKAPTLCRSFRTRYLLCAGGNRNAGGTITHYQIRGSTPQGVGTTTLMKAGKTSCGSMKFSFFGNASKNTLAVVTVNGTFRKSTEHKSVTLAANVTHKPFRIKLTQDGPAPNHAYAYISGQATCGTSSGK